MAPIILPANWGTDHLSILLYAETRCVDYKGELNPRQIRQDGTAHPTRLRRLDGQLPREQPGHNDIDCLLDFQAAGLLYVSGAASLVVILDDLGWTCAQIARRRRAEGAGVYSTLDAIVAELLRHELTKSET